MLKIDAFSTKNHLADKKAKFKDFNSIINAEGILHKISILRRPINFTVWGFLGGCIEKLISDLN